MAVITARAAAGGIGSGVPIPVSDGDEDIWFVHQMIIQHDDLVATRPQMGVYDIDSKAMRKIPQGSVIVAVVQNSHATQGFTAMDGIRVLTKFTQV